MAVNFGGVQVVRAFAPVYERNAMGAIVNLLSMAGCLAAIPPLAGYLPLEGSRPPPPAPPPS